MLHRGCCMKLHKPRGNARHLRYLVEVHDEGMRVGGAHVEDVERAGLHVGRSPVQEADYCHLACVLVLAQQCERAAALAAPAAPAARELLQFPVPTVGQRHTVRALQGGHVEGAACTGVSSLPGEPLAGLCEHKGLAAADLGCPLIGLLLYRTPLLLQTLSPCLEVPLEKDSPWRGVLGDGGCELLRSWSLAVSSLSRSKWPRAMSDGRAVEVLMNGGPGFASSSSTLLG